MIKSKTAKISMEDLSALKVQMTERIERQKEQLEYSAKNLFPSTPMQVVSAATGLVSTATGIMAGTRNFKKGLSLINGLIIGYKLTKGIGNFIRKKRKK